MSLIQLKSLLKNKLHFSYVGITVIVYLHGVLATRNKIILINYSVIGETYCRSFCVYVNERDKEMLQFIRTSKLVACSNSLLNSNHNFWGSLVHGIYAGFDTLISPDRTIRTIVARISALFTNIGLRNRSDIRGRTGN